MLTIIVKITAKPGKAAETKAILKGLVPITLREKGCHRYDLYQSLEKENVFFFYEVWESQAHLDDHIRQEHTANFFAKSEELLGEPIEISPISKL